MIITSVSDLVVRPTIFRHATLHTIPRGGVLYSYKSADQLTRDAVPWISMRLLELPSGCGRRGHHAGPRAQVEAFCTQQAISRKSENCPRPVRTFAEAGFPDSVAAAIRPGPPGVVKRA